MKFLIYYLIIINIAGFFFMLSDKHKAKKGKWRIPESTLIGIACFGGSIGVLAGMYTFRHKTLHPKFSVGVPVILALRVTAAVILFVLFAP